MLDEDLDNIDDMLVLFRSDNNAEDVMLEADPAHARGDLAATNFHDPDHHIHVACHPPGE